MLLQILQFFTVPRWALLLLVFCQLLLSADLVRDALLPEDWAVAGGEVRHGARPQPDPVTALQHTVRQQVGAVEVRQSAVLSGKVCRWMPAAATNRGPACRRSAREGDAGPPAWRRVRIRC